MPDDDIISEDIHSFLKNLADGDISALGDLYDRLSKQMLNYANTIVRNNATAEDIVHDVFLLIHSNSKRILKAKNPEGYIMTMVRNRAYNLLKSKKMSETGMNLIPDIVDESSSEETLITADALDTLPKNQREALYLHLNCGYTHNEVALIQGIPLVTAKWRYAKALSRLREYFSQTQ